VLEDTCEVIVTSLLCEVSLLIKLNQNNHERQCVVLHNFHIGVMHVRNSHRGPITYRNEKWFSGLAWKYIVNVKKVKIAKEKTTEIKKSRLKNLDNSLALSPRWHYLDQLGTKIFLCAPRAHTNGHSVSFRVTYASLDIEATFKYLTNDLSCDIS
jgi:hypothetical protein